MPFIFPLQKMYLSYLPLSDPFAPVTENKIAIKINSLSLEVSLGGLVALSSAWVKDLGLAFNEGIFHENNPGNHKKTTSVVFYVEQRRIRGAQEIVEDGELSCPLQSRPGS